MNIENKKIKVGFIITIIMLLAFSSMADRTRGGVLFLLIGPGARATGMGEAFVAVADDPTATYWNPAGLGNYPLSSIYLEVDNPPGSHIKVIGTEKSGSIDIDYRSFNIWAATDSGLYMLDGKKWISGESHNTAEQEKLMDVVYSYIDGNTFDSTAVYDQVVPAILKANGMKSIPEGYLPPDTKIKIPFSAVIDGEITALYGDKKELWVGTNKGIYLRTRGVWEKEMDSSGPAGKSVTLIDKDDRGYLYVGTTDGFYFRKGSRWVRLITGDGLPGREILSFYSGDSRHMWIGTNLGPATLSGDRAEDTYVVKSTAAASWKELVTRYMPFQSDKRLEYAISEIRVRNNAVEADVPPQGKNYNIPYAAAFESAVTSIYVDNYGVTWFGTELGLKSFDGQKWNFYGWDTTTVDKDISIKDWVNNQWPEASVELTDKLVEQLRYYNRFNAQDFKSGDLIAYPNSPLSGKITSIERSPQGDVLVGTEYGTLVYDHEKGNFKYYIHGDLKDVTLDQIIRHSNEYWYNTGDKIQVYSKGKSGISFMHVQWLPMLAPDLYYEFLSGTTYLEGWGTVGGAITYINEGQNEWTDEDGTVLGTFSSYELAVSACYGTRISEHFTAGLAFKFIYSALAKGVYVGMEQEEGVARTFAVDFGAQYFTPIRGLTLGMAVQNLGPDIHYIDAAQADPLPRNLKAGLSWKILDSQYNRLTFAADINKDLINVGNDPTLKEFRESVKNIGIEYSYSNFIFLRGGYMIDYDYIPTEATSVIQNEDYNPDHWKGINYFTLGAGLRYKNIAFDFGYIPLQEDDEEGKLVLSNILRYSATISF